MVVSGRLVAMTMIGAFIFIIGGSVLIINTSKGREYNRAITTKNQLQKGQLKVIQKFIKNKKKKFGSFTIEDLNNRCGSYEFIYFPEHIKDMREPVLVAKKESVLEYKQFDGKLSNVNTSIGFYVLFGDTLVDKTFPTKKLKGLLDLKLNADSGTYEIDRKYYQLTNKEIITDFRKLCLYQLIFKLIHHELVSLPMRQFMVNSVLVKMMIPEAYLIKKEFTEKEKLFKLKEYLVILFFQKLFEF